MIVNFIKDIDEFQHFRSQIEKLKVNNLAILQKTISEIPNSKRDFLKSILSFERVKNEPRQIYKIKRG
jgi:hypothetical protein